jgi:hypothetical protein
MLKILVLFILLFNFASSKYLTNESCKECHEKIYDEFQSSQHSKTFFNDELHKKVANKINQKKYSCAVCHMPGADNIDDLIEGNAKVDSKNPTHTDAISCYFCHTIAYVKKTHKFFVNKQAKQAEGFKPTLFGTLKVPDQTDKHSSVKSPIYTKNACKGCHSFKVNDYNTTIFNAMEEKQDSLECIKCHMPQIKGGNEKINKKARPTHISHKFLGIRDAEFRKSGVDINITTKDDNLLVSLKNKMAHPLIIQAARAKYLEIKIKRDGKVIWQNYKKTPSEDKQGYFAYSFKKDDKKIIIPFYATSASANNIEAKKTRILTYKTISFKKGDTIELSFWVKLAKDDCKKEVDLKDKELLKPLLINRVIKKL